MKIIWCLVTEIWSMKDNLLSFLDYFLPLYPPPSPSLLTTWKIKILKQWKMCGDIIILHMCSIIENYMMHGSWVPEIWSMTDRIFSRTGPFFALLTTPQNIKILERCHHFTHVYHKWKSYVWFLRYGAQQTKFFSFSTTFCHFIPQTTCKKWQKSLEILSFCTCVPEIKIMMYVFWDMECDRQKFPSFKPFFAFQHFEKMKKMPGDIIILHKSTKNHDHILCCS